MTEQDINLKKLEDLIKIQETDGNWNYSPYMLGLLNGMYLARSVFTDEDPQYKDHPETWIEDFETLQKFNKTNTVIIKDDI